MALNGDALGLAIKAAIDAVGDKTDREAVFKALGNALSRMTAKSYALAEKMARLPTPLAASNFCTKSVAAALEG